MNPTPDSTEKNETPTNSGASKPYWTAEQRLAFRILGRLGYEGDLLRPQSEQNLPEFLTFMFDTLVEEISEGVIGLGAPELPLDKTVKLAEAYSLGRHKTGGAE